MQKYYHKGGFFQDSDDPIFKRDTNLAVGEDNWDRSSLPSILMKRRGQFGMRGQTKYTHLTDQVITSNINMTKSFRIQPTSIHNLESTKLFKQKLRADLEDIKVRIP